MATKKDVAEAPAFVPGYKSVDRKGHWFKSNAQFVMEDPSNMGKGPLVRFEPQSYTQAEETPWVKLQHAAKVFTKYDGDPRDGAAEVPFEAPAVTAPAAPAPATKPPGK